MKKRILLCVVALVICLTLVGCVFDNAKDSNNIGENKQTSKSALSNKIITGGAKAAGSRFKIDLELLTINYDKIDGYEIDRNSIELYVMLKKKLSIEEKIDTHNKLIDYFKTITDDGMIYKMYVNEEFDKNETEATSINVRGIIDEKEYKIYIGGYSPRETYPESYSITIGLNK